MSKPTPTYAAASPKRFAQQHVHGSHCTEATEMLQTRQFQKANAKRNLAHHAAIWPSEARMLQLARSPNGCYGTPAVLQCWFTAGKARLRLQHWRTLATTTTCEAKLFAVRARDEETQDAFDNGAM